MSLFNIINISASALNAQSKKLNVCANNIANSESVLYKHKKLYPYIAKKVVLKYQDTNNSLVGGVNSDSVTTIKTPFRKIYDPSNPMANMKGYVKISNVNVIDETVNGIIAARHYQANIEILNTVKSMILKTLTIGD